MSAALEKSKSEKLTKEINDQSKETIDIGNLRKEVTETKEHSTVTSKSNEPSHHHISTPDKPEVLQISTP